ncbi:MAG: nicotinamide riboside transporter PnuC [Roseivirga sp.]
MSFFNMEHIAFDISGYAVSYVELIATIFGLLSVYFASRANILTWSTGIVNEFFLFILFYQVQLYPDMFLQVYFFIVTLYGWYFWKRKTKDNKITQTSPKGKLLLLTIIAIGTLVSGLFFRDIHLLLPSYFEKPAAYPWTDSFIMVSSIVATVLLARKKIETWYLWIALDIVCVILYFKKDIYVLSIEYLVFLLLASSGLYHWRKGAKHG